LPAGSGKKHRFPTTLKPEREKKNKKADKNKKKRGELSEETSRWRADAALEGKLRRVGGKTSTYTDQKQGEPTKTAAVGKVCVCVTQKWIGFARREGRSRTSPPGVLREKSGTNPQDLKE